MPRLLVREAGVHLIDTFRCLAGAIDGVYSVLRRLNSAIEGNDAALMPDRLGLVTERLPQKIQWGRRLTCQTPRAGRLCHLGFPKSICCRSLGEGRAACSVRAAVADALEAGICTPDLGGSATSEDVARAVTDRLKRRAGG
jgi:hypothetical protein